MRLTPAAAAAAWFCGLCLSTQAQDMHPDPSLGSASVVVSGTVARSYKTDPFSFGYSISFGEFAAPDFSSRTYTRLPETYIFSDPVNKVYSQKILNALDVPGTVYRLNQGLLDWRRAISKNRQPIFDSDQAGSGTGISTTLVGLDEYLQFVEKVMGTPLIVLNLLAAYEDLPDGTFKMHEPVNVNDPNDPYWPGIVQREAALIEYLNAPAGADWVGDGLKRGGWRPANHPQPYNVWNFELDNETNLVGAVFRYPADSSGVRAPVVRSLRPEEFTQRAVAVVNAMRAVAHNGGGYEGKLRFIAQTVTPVGNTLANSFDPNVLKDGAGNTVKEPLWPTQPTQSVLSYWNRTVLNGTASLSMDWSGVAKIPSWVPTTEYNPLTQELNGNSTVNICGDTTPAHQAENAAYCATQYFNLITPAGALGSPRSDGFYTQVTGAQASGLGPYLSGLGIHNYYDAPWAGYAEFDYWWAHKMPMVSLVPVDLLNESIKTWYTNTAQTGSRPKVSITEYGRDGVRNTDGNDQHPQLTGIYAAVAGSDFALAAAHRSYVDLMVHNGLAGWPNWWGQFAKPWYLGQGVCAADTSSAFATTPPMTFCNGDGSFEFRMRAEGRSINLVSRALYQADVLSTSVYTPATVEGRARDGVQRAASSYFGEFIDMNNASLGYDVRAIGLRYPGNGNEAVLAINRAEAAHPLLVSFVDIASGERKVMRVQSVGGSGLTDTTNTAVDPYAADPNYGNVWTRYVSAGFAGSSPAQARLNLPGHVVLAATVVGKDLLNNGDFESALSGTWTASVASGAGSCTVSPAQPAVSKGLNGDYVARLAGTNGAWCALRQGSGSNAALSASGELGKNLFDTYVLRANVRVSPGSDGAPVKTTIGAGGLKVLLNGSTAALGSNLVSTPTVNAGYAWAPMLVEFVPYSTLTGANLSSAEVQVTSGVPSLDIDGVTLMHRPNLALDPAFATLPTSGSKWRRSVSSFITSTTPSITLLSVSSPVRVQFRQASSSANVKTPLTLLQNASLQGTTATTLKPGGALDTGRADVWRLKAMMAYTGLNGAGAVLKVKLFDASGALLSDTVQGAYQLQTGASCSGTSPAPVLKGTSSGVTQYCLDFRPADVIGSSSYGGAEISIQYLDATPSGTLDVYFASLERLAD